MVHIRRREPGTGSFLSHGSSGDMMRTMFFPTRSGARQYCDELRAHGIGHSRPVRADLLLVVHRG